MTRAIKSLVILLALSLCQPCFGDTVTVRVINGKSGRPLSRQEVLVQFLDEKVEKAPAIDSSVLRLETNPNGEATFSIPDALPETLWIRVNLTSKHWHCGCMKFAKTETVIHKGVDAEPPPQSAVSSPVQAKPGQVVFIARPPTLIERLLYPIEKE